MTKFVPLWMTKATCNFINYKIVKKLQLPKTPKTHNFLISIIQIGNEDIWDKNMELYVKHHITHLDFHVTFVKYGFNFFIIDKHDVSLLHSL